MAAVLACGANAVLSHGSAAQLWGLLKPNPQCIDVTVRRGGGRKRLRGIRRHRSETLIGEETTRVQNVPVTTPARTIADLRRTASGAVLRRALREAAVIGLDVGEREGSAITRSEFEDRFLELCRRHRLPPPEVNAKVGRFTVDFLWRERGLIVETDGYRYHRGRQAFEEDRARDLELRLDGFEVVRFTHRQVFENSRRVAATIRRLLAGPVVKPP